MRRRLWGHHLPLALATTAILVVTAAALHRPDPRAAWSVGTAYAGLALIGLTLALGPIRMLRRGGAGVSFDLRRDVGIWAGGLSLVHVVLGLQAHMGGRIWLYFVPERFPVPPIRTDLFGAANYAGLAATAVVALLLALSNDLSLRRLGLRWKRLQRWNYLAFPLAILHTAAYQILDRRAVSWAIAVAAQLVLVIALQALGMRLRRGAGH